MHIFSFFNLLTIAQIHKYNKFLVINAMFICLKTVHILGAKGSKEIMSRFINQLIR